MRRWPLFLLCAAACRGTPSPLDADCRQEGVVHRFTAYHDQTRGEDLCVRESWRAGDLAGTTSHLAPEACRREAEALGKAGADCRPLAGRRASWTACRSDRDCTVVRSPCGAHAANAGHAADVRVEEERADARKECAPAAGPVPGAGCLEGACVLQAAD